MTILRIIVPCFQNVAFETQLDAALQVARRFNAHIDAIFIRPDPVMVAASVPEMLMAAGIALEKLETEGMAAEDDAAAAFEAWREAHDLTAGSRANIGVAPTAAWHARIGSVETVLVEAGRLADLIVLNRPDYMETINERAFDAAVFETGRPALMVPPGLPEDLMAHAVVAWNGSLEATRAVAGAMPLLHEAEHVSIFSRPRPHDTVLRNLDLADHLAWQGIAAELAPTRPEEPAVGAALLASADELGATLLVMGAYTHSRVRELLLGGVTRHVIRHAAIPILMMH